MGLTFTSEEAFEWVNEQHTMQQVGELSKMQLEFVASGKSNSSKAEAFSGALGCEAAGTMILSGVAACATGVGAAAGVSLITGGSAVVVATNKT